MDGYEIHDYPMTSVVQRDDVPAGAPPPVMTLDELAAFLRVSRDTAQRMGFPAVQVGKNRWRYVTDQVLEHLKRSAK